MKYRCKHCNKTVQRDSIKAWIKSYCSKAGITVHIVRIKEAV